MFALNKLLNILATRAILVIRQFVVMNCSMLGRYLMNARYFWLYLSLNCFKEHSLLFFFVCLVCNDIIKYYLVVQLILI